MPLHHKYELISWFKLFDHLMLAVLSKLLLKADKSGPIENILRYFAVLLFSNIHYKKILVLIYIAK